MARRTILHADMDAFYASVEQRDDPALRGRPVAVGGQPPRGVVAAASYEARVFGVRSAMPTIRALDLCPDLALRPPRIGHYQRISSQIFEVFQSFSPLVEPLSLDEAFVDLCQTERLHGEPVEVARSLRRQVRQRVDLTVSVGVAPNKFLAKIASDFDKPDGLVVIDEDQVAAFLAPLDIRHLFGVGQATAATLRDLGIQTIGALARTPRDVLIRRIGSHGDQLWQLAHGVDDRPVVPNRPPDSIGHEDTFSRDLDDLESLGIHIQRQADRVAHRLRSCGYRAGAVALKLKTARHKQRTRRRRLPHPSADGTLLGRVARQLLEEMAPSLGPLRLTGVTATALVREDAPRQLTLDQPAVARQDELGQTLDAIADRFGRGAVVRACSLDRNTQGKTRR